jgi:hypothetical protein
MTRHTAVLALLVVATLATAAPAAAAPDVYAIDGDHPLTTDSAVEEYRETGRVARNTTQLAMTITVADDREQANVSGPALPGSPGDLTTTYLCVDYRESVERTVRFNLPREYAVPRAAELSAVGGGPTATLDPTADRNDTAVTVRFDGPARACYELDTVQGQIVEVKSWSRGLLNQSLGVEVPSLGNGGDAQWEYVPAGAFAVNSTYQIPRDAETVMIQYDASNANQTAPTWVPVRECSDPSDQPVCVVERQSDRIELLAASGDAPPVRYRQGGSATGDLAAAVRGIQHAASNFIAEARAFVGGVF